MLLFLRKGRTLPSCWLLMLLREAAVPPTGALFATVRPVLCIVPALLLLPAGAGAVGPRTASIAVLPGAMCASSITRAATDPAPCGSGGLALKENMGFTALMRQVKSTRVDIAFVTNLLVPAQESDRHLVTC